jgi:cytochrome c
MWRGALAVAVGTMVFAACGNTEPSSTPVMPPKPGSGREPTSSATVTARESNTTTRGELTSPPVSATPANRDVAILVLTRTAGFRHTSIEPATEALVGGLRELGIDVIVDPDATRVSPAALADFDAVVMLSTKGDWLNDEQQSAIEQWAANGGGIAGIHAATDAELDWRFIEDVFAARFAGHPAVQQATVVVEDRTHPATAVLPVTWVVSDEWYNFAPHPRDHVRVLARVDESTYTGGTMGSDHPVEWARDPSPVTGRVWYTAMGHPDALWFDPTFVEHVVAGVAWTAGVDPRGVDGFSMGATVHEVADRLGAIELS